MSMSDDSNDIDGNGAILTKSMMMDMAQRSTMATATTTATVTLVSVGGCKPHRPCENEHYVQEEDIEEEEASEKQAVSCELRGERVQQPEEGGISSYPLERVIQPQQPRWQWRDSNDVDDDSNDAMCDDNNNDDNDDDYGNDDGEGNDDINANGVMGSGIQPQGETKIIQTGRQKGLDQIKRDHELMRSRTSEAEKYLQELSEKEAVEKALEKRLRAADEAKQAADEAKQNAFNKFKNDLVFRKERKRQALILANNLRKLLKHYWFRKHYEVVWRKYSKEKVAASKVAIWLYKNSIRRLRKMKMSAMVSLGQWINSLSPGRMLSNFSQIPSVSAPTSAGAGDVSADDADSAVIAAPHNAATDASDAAVAAVMANTTDADTDSDADNDADHVKDIIQPLWTQLSKNQNHVAAIREARYESNVDLYRGMMVTENFQSSVGVSSFAAATAAVGDITNTDTDAVKDIDRGRMNQHNVQEEDIEEEEGSEKQASKDTWDIWVAAQRGTTMAMSDDSNDIDGNGAISTKSMMMVTAQRSTMTTTTKTMATATTTATVTLMNGVGVNHTDPVMNQHNVLEEDIEEEEGREKQASKDSGVVAQRDMVRTTMAMSDNDNDIDVNGASATKSMMMATSTSRQAATTTTMKTMATATTTVEDMTKKYPFDEQVDKKWRSKVTFMGITYNSTGPAKKPAVEKQVNEVTKYYSCGMVQETRNGPWKPSQQKRGTETTTKEEERKLTKKVGNGGGSKREKKLPISSKMRCSGTLIATYRRFGRHSFTIKKAHMCNSGQVCSGEPDNRIPMVVITPNVSWDVRRDKLMGVKEQLLKLGQINWHNLRGCGTNRQYLPGLSTDGKHKLLKNDVEECIGPFVVHYITKTNPKVNRFKVGALRSKGSMSQASLSGVYHRDYKQDEVNRRSPDERPFSIILALDEFRLQYKDENMSNEVKTVNVPIGHAAVFSSALSHCGGENGTDDYVYRLFAYVVSDDLDYPVRDVESDIKDDSCVQKKEGGI